MLETRIFLCAIVPWTNCKVLPPTCTLLPLGPVPFLACLGAMGPLGCPPALGVDYWGLPYSKVNISKKC